MAHAAGTQQFLTNEKEMLRYKKRPKLLAVFMVPVLLVLPVSAEQPPATAADSEATATALPVEEVSLRNANSKHFRLADGSYTAVAYVHYPQGDGWAERITALFPRLCMGMAPPVTVYIGSDEPLSLDEPETVQTSDFRGKTHLKLQ